MVKVGAAAAAKIVCANPTAPAAQLKLSDRSAATEAQQRRKGLLEPRPASEPGPSEDQCERQLCDDANVRLCDSKNSPSAALFASSSSASADVHSYGKEGRSRHEEQQTGLDEKMDG